jgi:formimidoylglutamate deiminase
MPDAGSGMPDRGTGVRDPGTGMARTLWAPRAWIDGRWHDGVLLAVDAGGHWERVAPGVGAPPPDATVLPGPVLPGLVDAHSHAFQRAFAGLAERLAPGSDAGDDFWSWRDRMYGVALRITPEQLRAVAAQLYAELLLGGYTHVCEFHYLFHAPDGRPYEDPCALAWALADAAEQAGCGLTVLPTLYERAGFAAPMLRDDQRRFASTPASVLAMQRAIRDARRPRVDAGIAIHSLRAAAPGSIAAVLKRVDGEPMPIHVHVAEQQREVDDCLSATGARPIEWLCRTQRLDARWQLVHATHAEPAEIEAVAATGAGIVLCPSTEANLGDGLPDLPRWLAAGVPLGIGSDSQVARAAAEELRWLEYGQRLVARRRNVAASSAQAASAARLFDAAIASGARSAGLDRWGLVVGARADALVIDDHAPGILGVPPENTLDALVFATDAPAFVEVWVAGRRVVADRRHVDAAAVAERFRRAMDALWQHRRPDQDERA